MLSRCNRKRNVYIGFSKTNSDTSIVNRRVPSALSIAPQKFMCSVDDYFNSVSFNKEETIDVIICQYMMFNESKATSICKILDLYADLL